MSAIKARDVRLLDVEGLRALVRVCNNTEETINTGLRGKMDAQGILDMWWEAVDQGIDGIDSVEGDIARIVHKHEDRSVARAARKAKNK